MITCTDIHYDTDGEEIEGLPTELHFTLADFEGFEDAFEDWDSLSHRLLKMVERDWLVAWFDVEFLGCRIGRVSG